MAEIIGKYTVELYAQENSISRQSALNKLSGLKKKGFVKVSGGGKQKRIYTLYKRPVREPNGFYSIVNKYAKIKLTPEFEHYIYGRYTVEDAIIDGLKIDNARTKIAVSNLFRHITDWTYLMHKAKGNNLLERLHEYYEYARKSTKCKRMPKRYMKESIKND